MRTSVFFVSASLCTLLAACGGGGGTNSTPTPVPSPTPTPTPAAYQKLDQLTGNRSFELSGVHLDRRDAGSVGEAMPSSGRATISYDAAADTYTLSAPLSGGYSVTLGPAEKSVSGTVPDQVAYNRITAQNIDQVFIIRPAQNGVSLSYTMMVGWGFRPPGGDIQVIWGVGGIPTRADDMPRTGSSTYRTFPVRGSIVADGALLPIQNTQATLVADFATGNIKSTLQMTGSTFDWRYVGNGSITSGTSGFSGTLTPDMASSAPGRGAGKFDGGFFGPAAAEVGFAWYLTDPTLEASGLVAGTRPSP